jgi:hypothetical protein
MQDSGPKQEKLLEAIKTMNDIEQVLINIVKFEPQWCNLLKSVDTRVDKILNSLYMRYPDSFFHVYEILSLVF